MVKTLLDLVGKPADLLAPNHDVQVWFGYRFAGWLAKLLTLPHLVIYGYAAYGLWRLTSLGWWVAFLCCCTCRLRYSCICCCTPQVRVEIIFAGISLLLIAVIAVYLYKQRHLLDLSVEVDKSIRRCLSTQTTHPSPCATLGPLFCVCNPAAPKITEVLGITRLVGLNHVFTARLDRRRWSLPTSILQDCREQRAVDQVQIAGQSIPHALPAAPDRTPDGPTSGGRAAANSLAHTCAASQGTAASACIQRPTSVGPGAQQVMGQAHAQGQHPPPTKLTGLCHAARPVELRRRLEHGRYIRSTP